METIKTLCPYCGVGCGLEVVPDKKQSWKVRGDRNHPSSQGMVCIKGATVAESIRSDRLLYPMMRDTLDQPFRRASWDEAFDAIVNRIQTIRSTTGPDALCVYGSGQFVTEDYYVAQKLMKGCLGTNNFDANSRLCMSSAVSGYIQSFGSDGPPCCYDDLELTDCAFIVGSNTAECHPIVFNRLAKYHKKNPNVKMIVVDPRRTPTAEAADLHLAIKPGTDIDLFNGIAYLLLRKRAIDPEFIQDCTENFSAFAEVISSYTPDFVASRCGISVSDLETAARYWEQSQRVLSLWSMGINQSSEGTAKVRSLINLHLMTGQIGKPGCGPFSLTGQPNAMGGREAGGLSHLLPGYRFVKNAEHRTQVEEFWGIAPGSISPNPGRTAWEMILGLETGDVELLWIAATNPVVSMPDLERTKAALLRSPLTIYQEAYYPTETSAYAHILLPATQWSEKTGVMTNSERRVTLGPGFDIPLGEARDDWSIFAEVGRRLGFAEHFAFDSSADVYQEFVQLTRGRPCDVTGLSHEYLRLQGPQQWPCPENEPPYPANEAKRLYTDRRFHTDDGRAKFSAYHSRGLAEPPDPNYPFVLTTGRLYGHWHTMTRTGRTEKINQLHPDPFLEIHPRDAAKLQINEGDLLEVRSRRGKARFPAKVTKAIAPGTLFVPMHWGALWAEEAEANAMTHSASCPDSKQPELKACAVQLVLVGAETAAPAVAEVAAGVEEFNWAKSTVAVTSLSGL
ncbi:nitrate reductase [Tychonema sp. LEGE 07199]|uniref:molybdopterin oxidoreductase family protein n=1 Tax=unclassified Tychonema TaxID=2642144 RepID=UPI001881B9F3|nr:MULTISPECIES: nitrate reductase [unclassified Tychonema]MBE9124231.1 nitrate reductase [Tychonema sp. LEGE 07199]MBE9135391.1 nitrate reductase [Tychonema sp. LEGE 07196]